MPSHASLGSSGPALDRDRRPRWRRACPAARHPGFARARRSYWRWRSESRNWCRRARPRPVRRCPVLVNRPPTWGVRRARSGTVAAPGARTHGFEVARSKPMRKAAVVKRLLSSGPAGMPKGRLTGWPKKVAKAPSEAPSLVVPAASAPLPSFSASANAPNGPCS